MIAVDAASNPDKSRNFAQANPSCTQSVAKLPLDSRLTLFAQSADEP
jgi:hypothetical protein